MDTKPVFPSDYECLSCKKLLVIAKEYNIVGRHDMTKVDLINSIRKFESNNQPIENESQDEFTLTPDEKKLIEDNDTEEETLDTFDKKIIEKEEQMPSKKQYEDSAKIGTLVAFSLPTGKVISGKIVEIYAARFAIETKSGLKFYVKKNEVLWYKTGSRWPAHIYRQLRGEVVEGN